MRPSCAEKEIRPCRWSRMSLCEGKRGATLSETMSRSSFKKRSEGAETNQYSNTKPDPQMACKLCGSEHVQAKKM